MNGKINLFLCLLICVSVLFSCAMPEKTEPAPVKPDYEKVPFVSGQKVPVFDDEVKSKNLIGTYKFIINGNAFTEYWLSLYADGTAKAVRQSSLVDSTDKLFSGTWSNDGDAFSISIEGLVTRTDVPLNWSKWETDKLIKYPADSYYNELMYKVSDQTMDTSIYSDTSGICGLWAISDDYGEITGLRILSDNTVWHYSTTSAEGKGSKRNWKLATTKTEIKFSDIMYPDSFYDTYSIVRVGDYLLLGSTAYAKIK